MTEDSNTGKFALLTAQLYTYSANFKVCMTCMKKDFCPFTHKSESIIVGIDIKQASE